MTRKLGDVLLSVFSLVTRGGAQSIGRNGGRRMKGKVAAFSFMSGVAVALALLCSSGTVLGSQGYLTTFNNNYGNTRNPLGTVYNCGVCHTTSGASSSARNPFGTAWASTGARAIPINTALGNLDTDGDGATNAAELSAGTYPLVPMVAISAPPAGTVSGTVTVTASASDNTGRSTVAGVRFTLDGVNLGAEDTASPYSISWNTTTASNGTHTLRAVARDALGNTATSVAVTVNVSNTDATPPTVTINQAGNQTDPTSSSPINFTVVFSEAVTGFAAVDVTISGTAGGAKTVTISGTGPTYTVAVSGMTTSGTVIASIGAGVVQDGAGNPNTASTSTDNSVIYNAPDTTSPTVTINQAAAQTDPTSSSPINFTVVFSETVTGFTAADVTIGGTAGGTKTVAISGTGPTYTVAVSGVTTSGTVIASIAAGVVQDGAGNPNTASTSTDNSVIYNAPDTTSPTVTINQAGNQTDPTSSSPINFTVVFSEAVTGFAAVDVTISGTAGGAKTVTISGTGPTYAVAVSGMTTSGTVIASIGAGVVQDGAGNPNTASTSTDNSVIYNAPDTTSPTVTINQAAAQTDPTSSSPINFTVVFSETVTGFAAVDVTISGTAGGAKTVTISGTGPTYTVAVSGMTTSGTVIASIGAGVVQDAAANLNTASTSTDNTVTFTLQPTVTFQDVPETHFAFNHIEAIYAAGITGGCQADVQGTPENEALFCPDLIVDRGQMSAFIIRALDGGNPVGGCNQVPFSDVPTNHIFCAHIEQMALRGITLGIGGGLFGPNLPLRREQMAAFLIRAVLPGDPQGVCVEPPFPDVPVDSSFCRHIEELVARQITLGCIGDDPVTAGNEARFCPVELVTRAQMAVFLGRAFLGNP